jgi:hypothetical protein
MRTTSFASLVLVAFTSAACAQQQAAEAPPASPFPHISINADEKYVDIEATVPITLDDPDAPFVYLELIACTPDTKEHESLVVTPAKPSHVHAALLLLGLEPGSPGSWEWEGDALKPIPPAGGSVRIEFHYTGADGAPVVSRPQDWIINAQTGERFPDGDWVFAGSRMIEWRGEEYYDADGAGTLVGLTTFGSEVLAWPAVISPEATVEEPVWIADEATTPPLDTPVIIRLRVVENE